MILVLWLFIFYNIYSTLSSKLLGYIVFLYILQLNRFIFRCPCNHVWLITLQSSCIQPFSICTRVKTRTIGLLKFTERNRVGEYAEGINVCDTSATLPIPDIVRLKIQYQSSSKYLLNYPLAVTKNLWFF